MKTLRFEGHSDDTFGEYAETNIDHDNCANGEPIAFRVTAGGESCLVVGYYAPGRRACWTVGLCQDDEDVPLPSWVSSARFGAENYTTKLTITVPDDFTIEHAPEREGR